MSYIRSGSNPEHLYIWGDVDNMTTISNTQNKCFTFPTKDWERLIAKWGRTHGWADEKKGIRVGKLLLKEETIHIKNPFKLSWLWQDFQHFFFKSEVLKTFKDKVKTYPIHCRWRRNSSEFKWILYHKGKRVCEMWTTTMWYIAFSNTQHWKPKMRKNEMW